MANHQHAVPAPVGGKLLSATTFTCGVLVAIMLAILVVRFFSGLGAVTNLNDGYPWGIWVVVDVVIGSSFACGGFAVAMLVYIFNRGEYHALVRPALLASLFGYSLAGAGVLFDLGRWWNFWHILAPGFVNVNSVMFEVAACISAYILVMWIEFSPAFLEQLQKHEAKKKLNKILFFIIALGTVLPMMHQSSLGTMLVVMGVHTHPLWNTPLQPLLYLLTAVSMGYGVVLVESCLTSAAYRRSIETHLLTPLSKIMLTILAVFLAIRLGDVVVRGALPTAFTFTIEALFFWIETALFVVPLVMLRSEERRRNPSLLFLAGLALMGGGALLRLNGYLIGREVFNDFHYFPSLAEILVTLGMFAIEVLGYIVITRRFPVLPREV